MRETIGGRWGGVGPQNQEVGKKRPTGSLRGPGVPGSSFWAALTFGGPRAFTSGEGKPGLVERLGDPGARARARLCWLGVGVPLEWLVTPQGAVS